MSETEKMNVRFEAGLQKTKIPGRYRVVLLVDGYFTRIETRAWGVKRAHKARDEILENAQELIDAAGLTEGIYTFLWNERKEKALADVKPGDRVRLAVDIGPFKAGRVCKVMAVNPDGETTHGVSVQPVYVSGDGVTFGEGDYISLTAGEYAPLNEEA
jgi:hypothetical protein